MAVEMAQAADGTEKNVTSKEINSDGLNYDSDQHIMAATKVRNGKWVFEEGGVVIAEADAPAEKTRAVLEQWCSAVRSRTKRELTMDDLTAREQGRKRKENETQDEVSEGGIVIPAGSSVDSSGDTDAVESNTPAPSKEEDPDAWIGAKIESSKKTIRGIKLRQAELNEELDQVGTEFCNAEQELAKWNRLQTAMNGED